MTHPLLRKEIFVETAFEKRFQAMLRLAWQRRSWHVIVADPGSGKSVGIRDLTRRFRRKPPPGWGGFTRMFGMHKYRPITVEQLAGAMLRVARARSHLGEALEGKSLWEVVDAGA